MNDNDVLDRLAKLEERMGEQAVQSARILSELAHVRETLNRISGIVDWATGERALTAARDKRLDVVEQDLANLREQVANLQSTIKLWTGILAAIGALLSVLHPVIERFVERMITK